MYKHTMLISCCVLLLLLTGFAACDTTTNTSPWGGPDLITVALPYVEAVHFPVEVHAGQPFVVTIDISSDLNPLALRSPARPFPTADFRGGQYYTPGGLPYSMVIKPFRDLTQASASLPVITSVTYDLDPIPAGTYKLYYLGAASREQGGVNIAFDRQTQSEMIDASKYIKTLEFTVLP
jgi:hypothetical protein